MPADPAKIQIPLFLAYRIASRLYFHLPILFLQFMSVEMGLFNVIALLAAYGLAITVSASLSQVLGRLFSKKNVIILGEVLKVVNILCIISATSPGQVNLELLFVGQILGGCGFSLALSTDSALLRSVSQNVANADFGKLQARSQGQMFIATLIAGSIGAMLYNNQPDWPFFAALTANVIAIIIVSMIKETTPDMNSAVMPESPHVDFGRSRRSWMTFYAVSRAFAIAPFIGFLPYYFTMMGVDQVLFGMVLGVFTFAGFIAAMGSAAFLARFGLTVLAVLTLGCMIGSIVFFGFGDLLSDMGVDYFTSGLVGIALLGLSSGGVRPLTMQNLDLGSLPSNAGIKLLSEMEREYGFWNAVLMLSGGYVMSLIGFIHMMRWLVVAYIAVVCVLAFIYYITTQINKTTHGPSQLWGGNCS